MASTVEVANRALQKVGAKSITSLSDNTVEARACNLAMEPCKLALLEDHFWGFSIQRFQLAAASTDPLFNKENFFPLPDGFVKLAPQDAEATLESKDWLIENAGIATNDSAPLEVRCVINETDPNKMTALFREAWAAKVAYEICEQLTQSNTKKAQLGLDLDDILNRAKKSNGIQSIPQVPTDDIWLTARQ